MCQLPSASPRWFFPFANKRSPIRLGVFSSSGTQARKSKDSIIFPPELSGLILFRRICLFLCQNRGVLFRIQSVQNNFSLTTVFPNGFRTENDFLFLRCVCPTVLCLSSPWPVPASTPARVVFGAWPVTQSPILWLVDSGVASDLWLLRDMLLGA